MTISLIGKSMVIIKSMLQKIRPTTDIKIGLNGVDKT